MPDHHDFDGKRGEGERWEKVVIRSYQGEYRVTRCFDLGIQRTGNDYIFAPRGGGPAFGVEIKADSRAAQTGNFCAELWSVAGLKEGWALTSTAALLLYCIPPDRVVYEVPMTAFRSKVAEWAARYPTRPVRNRDYETIIAIVPLHELASVATAIRFIPT